MAQRRMFSPTLVDTDMFLDMPSSAQNLYFHLGIRADDDGFVSSPKKIMSMCNASQDDMKVLIAKNYIIPFESGIVVITSWRINNLIRKDWYKPTVHKEEMAQLSEKDGIYFVNDSLTIRRRRLGKVRLGKDRIGKVTTEAKPTVSPEGALIIEKFLTINPSLKYGNRTQRQACDDMIQHFGLQETLDMVDMVIAAQGKKYAPRVTTPYAMWQKIGDLKSYFSSEVDKSKKFTIDVI